MHSIYAIHDSQLEQFKQPWTAQNEKEAIRAFHRATLLPDSDFLLFPQHFNLYQLGTFDNETGIIEAIVPPKFIIGATSFKKEQ